MHANEKCYSSKPLELVCVTTIIIAIVLLAFGASLYDRSPNDNESSSASHANFVGYVIILVGVGFICISVILCFILVILKEKKQNNIQQSSQQIINYTTFDKPTETV